MGQQLPVTVANGGHAVLAHVQATDHVLEHPQPHPCQQPLPLLHGQRGPYHPRPFGQLFQRADVQLATEHPVPRHHPTVQRRVPLALGKWLAGIVHQGDRSQVAVALQYALDAGFQQLHRPVRYPPVVLTAIVGAASQGPFQSNQLRTQQAVAAIGQGHALPLCRFNPAAAIVPQHHRQCRCQQHRHQRTRDGDHPQWMSPYPVHG
ncbi:hypothetical protein D3C81_937650 [compost metagenome]